MDTEEPKNGFPHLAKAGGIETMALGFQEHPGGLKKKKWCAVLR